MNANHARPLAAYWLLAILAALVTAVGLRAAPPSVEVPGGSPTRVTGTGSPELVLGGVLRARPPSPVAVQPLLPTAATAIVVQAASTVPSAASPAPTKSRTRPRTSTANGTGGSATPVNSTGGTAVPVRSSGATHGNGSARASHKAPGQTTTATARATTTKGAGHGKVHRKGNGKGIATGHVK